MTAVANETTLDVEVDVRFTAAGAPLAVRFDGRIWAVGADPVHWFARNDWWNTRRTAALGTGDVVSVEYGPVLLRVSAGAIWRIESYWFNGCRR